MSEYINNQTLREERLKSIIRELHEGQSADEVKAAFAGMLSMLDLTRSCALRGGPWSTRG